MAEPPPLPPSAVSPLARRTLSGASVAAIVAGQLVTNGALYGLTFVGLAVGITFLLKDALETAGRGVYILAFIAPLLIILMMLLIYGSLFLGLCASAYLFFTRRHAATIGRLMMGVFAFLAVGIVCGLISMCWLEARPEFHGTPLCAPKFFIWPITFAILAFAYAKLFPKIRNA